jgi:hypothetical protein
MFCFNDRKTGLGLLNIYIRETDAEIIRSNMVIESVFIF